MSNRKTIKRSLKRLLNEKQKLNQQIAGLKCTILVTCTC